MKVISPTDLHNEMKDTKQDHLPEDFHIAISMDEAISRVESGMREVIKKGYSSSFFRYSSEKSL